MMETLMNMKNLESHSNKETMGQYLKSLNDFDGPTVLETFVNELPKNERRLVYCKFWRNMNNDEISKTMRIEKSKVEIILKDAISLLRHKIITRLVELEPEWELEDNTTQIAQ